MWHYNKVQLQHCVVSSVYISECNDRIRNMDGVVSLYIISNTGNFIIFLLSLYISRKVVNITDYKNLEEPAEFEDLHKSDEKSSHLLSSDTEEEDVFTHPFTIEDTDITPDNALETSL
jgi:hypothetical protein